MDLKHFFVFFFLILSLVYFLTFSVKMNLQETNLNTSNHKKFSRYLNFCVDFFVMWKNDLVRKISLISKCPTTTLSDLTQVSPLFTTQPKLRSVKSLMF